MRPVALGRKTGSTSAASSRTKVAASSVVEPATDEHPVREYLARPPGLAETPSIAAQLTDRLGFTKR